MTEIQKRKLIPKEFNHQSGRVGRIFFECLPLVCVFLAYLTWADHLSVGPVFRIIIAVAVMFVLPGYVFLKLIISKRGIPFSWLEKIPVIFCVSIGLWVLLSVFAFRMQADSDAVIAGVLAFNLTGWLFVQLNFLSGKAGIKTELAFKFADIKEGHYILAVIVLVIIVTMMVFFSAEFHRWDFDTSLHLAGYHKIAIGSTIIGQNPYLGPGYDYLIHYVANPWYLAVGLTARLAQVSVTYLYVSLAVLLTPLVFIGFYSLLKAMIRDHRIAITGMLMAVGPWIFKLADELGPSTGTFHFQFLPFPYHFTEYVTFPIVIAACFHYLNRPNRITMFLLLCLSFAAMGPHPVFLLVIPATICFLFFVMSFFQRFRKYRIQMLSASLIIITLAGALAWHTLNPIDKELMTGVGYNYDPDTYMKIFLAKAWIPRPYFYALHPKSILTQYWKAIIGCFLICFWLFGLSAKSIGSLKQSLRSIEKSIGFYRGIGLISMFLVPFLVCYNPLIVPMVVKILDSPVPVWRMNDVYVVLKIACQFGALSFIFFMAVERLTWLQQPKKQVLAISLIFVGIPLILTRAGIHLKSIVYDRVGSVSILEMTRSPLFNHMADLEPGVVAIKKELAEYLLMTTPHYVLSSGRMVEQRWIENDSIVRFSVSLDQMRKLLKKHKCNYIVVPVSTNCIANSEFNGHVKHWDNGLSVSSRAVPGGENGYALQLKASKAYGSQIIYQNISCQKDGFYRLRAFVKSGSSGNEPFKIQVFRANTAGKPILTLSGTSQNSWKQVTGVFKAVDDNMSVVLRKNSPTAGTMLFDSIECTRKRQEAGSGNSRGLTGQVYVDDPVVDHFSMYPQLFAPVIKLDDHVVFEVNRSSVVYGSKQQ